MLKVCGTKNGRYCTDLDAYISKIQKVPVNAKYYRKEIMSSKYLLFIDLGLHTDYFSAFHLLIWLQPVITTFRVSEKSW